MSNEIDPPPFKLIPFREGDWNDWHHESQQLMIVAHNIMIRALNSIYIQARIPWTAAEKYSFAGYVLSWCEFTKHHHQAEETFWFPECEKRKPGSMAVNLEQHHAFHDGLETIEKYFIYIQKNINSYNGDKVIELIDTFGPVLINHLTDEIETLEPQKMKEIFDDPMEAKQIITNMVKWIVSTAPPTTQLPFVMSHHDLRSCPWWPDRDIPWLVIVLGRYVVPWRHYGYWRWAPFTTTGYIKPGAKVEEIPFSKGP